MRAGRTGYILKPPSLRISEEIRLEGDEIVFNDEDPEPIELRGRLISGWQLPRPWGHKELYLYDKISKPYVQIFHIHKNTIIDEIEASFEICECQTPLLPASNPYNPQWDFPFSYKIHNIETEMILFLVRDHRPKLNCPFIGYYAITVADISVGYRVIPLKGDQGLPLISGQLFVYIDDYTKKKSTKNTEEAI